MSDFEDDVLNSDVDLDYEVCEEDEEALLADDQGSRNNNPVTDARERILQRSISKGEEDWEEEEEDEDNEGRGRFLSERAPNPQVARPREDIPETLDQVEVPEADISNRRPQNFQNRGRGGRRGGRFFHRGGFRGRGRGGFNTNGNLRSLGDDGMRYHDQPPLMNNGPPSAPTKILINPHFKGPRPLLKTPNQYPEPEEPYRQFPPPPVNNHPPPGPGYQQYNPPLLPPPQPYHEPPRPYIEQPPPYHAPPQHRQPPPQEWVQAEPFFPGRPHHPDFSNAHRQPPQRPPLLQGPPPPQQQPPYGGPPPRGPYPGPQHRPPPPPQQYPPPYQQPPPHQLPPYAQPPPLQSYQQPPPPMNYPPPAGQPPFVMHGQPPPLGHQAPYYDQHSAAPPPMYTAPPLQHILPPLKDDFRPSIFLTERLERRRSRSRSRSPYYDRYRRRSRSRSRSYSPPRRYRDEIRREKLPPRRLSPEPLRKPLARQLSPLPPLLRKRDSPPPRKPSNPEEVAYLRAIEKQKQERETVLKMKAIKRKLEIEKKKRDGDKPEVTTPEKKNVPSPAGPSKEPAKVSVSPQAKVVNDPQMTKIVLKPKIKVIKKIEQEDSVRKISLVTNNPNINEPLITRTFNKNGEEFAVRRIVSANRDVVVRQVSSVLRGAEGPSMDQPFSKKIIKKSVVITKPASQAGLSSVGEDRVSLLSANKQMRLAITKSAKQVLPNGVTVAVENISSATTTETLKKMGLGMGLKAIKMKKVGSQQSAHMIFSTREGAEKFVKQNQRKVLDLSIIDVKVV